MNFDEMIEGIFNYVEEMTPSEIRDTIDKTFVRREVLTPFGVIVLYKRRSLIDSISEEAEEMNCSDCIHSKKGWSQRPCKQCLTIRRIGDKYALFERRNQ